MKLDEVEVEMQSATIIGGREEKIGKIFLLISATSMLPDEPIISVVFKGKSNIDRLLKTAFPQLLPLRKY